MDALARHDGEGPAMLTHMMWCQSADLDPVLIHPSDIVNMIFSTAIGSAPPDGSGTEDAPYTMSSVAQWFGAALTKKAAGYTWYSIGGRKIRRDFDPNYPDYMADNAHLANAAPSYPTLATDIHVNARAFPPTETAFSHYSAKLVARQIRGLLRGHNNLRIMDWEGIPVLVATIFIAELSRNQSSFIVSMMLLDLIQKDWQFADYGIPDWETVLWKETLRTTDMYNKSLGNVQSTTGLHPMARFESVKQSTAANLNARNLTQVRQMEAAIAMNWLKAKLGEKVELVGGATLSVMHHFIASETAESDLDNWKAKLAEGKPVKPLQLEKVSRQAILNEQIAPLIVERSQSFDFLLK